MLQNNVHLMFKWERFFIDCLYCSEDSPFSRWLDFYWFYCFLKCILLFQNRSRVTLCSYLLFWCLFLFALFCLLIQVKDTSAKYKNFILSLPHASTKCFLFLGSSQWSYKPFCSITLSLLIISNQTWFTSHLSIQQPIYIIYIAVYIFKL